MAARSRSPQRGGRGEAAGGLPKPATKLLPEIGDDSFALQVRGQIASAMFTGCDALSCSYDFHYDTRDWTMTDGQNLENPTNESQVAAFTSSARAGSAGAAGLQRPNFTWNFPIDATWTSSNPFGWPRLVLGVRDTKSRFRGYGSVLVPTTSGRHVRYVRLFVPKSSSPLQEILASLGLTPLPEFRDPMFAAKDDNRDATRCASAGVVKVVLNVNTIGMGEHGYSTKRNDARDA